jgi:hypothetical protein
MSSPDPAGLRPDTTGEPTSLPTLEAAGFSAAVDALAWEPDPDPAAHRMRLWLVSLLGTQEAVKALWARLVRGETATVRWETTGFARFCALAPEGPRRWRFYTAGLPASAGYQGVLVPEAALYEADRSDFLLVVPPDAGGHNESNLASMHYRFLNRRTDVPLHEGWAAWLWTRGVAQGEVVALETAGIRAYRCAANALALSADVTAAIRRGELTIPY